MEIVSIIIGVLGALASGYGAYLAIREAKKAKSSAEKAEEMKKAIATEQNKISLGRLYNETKNCMRVSIKMATSATPDKKLRGLDYQQSIGKIREYIDILKESCHYLPEPKVKLVEKEYKSIESQIVLLAKENDQSKKYEIGDGIHKSMGEIMKHIKPELDVKTFANKV
ncbi:hypothetical protein [Tenacibaculum finnmarkense]|uniref:hypothetical protein n=1 Tax=Tenacibaculum finnmarkense TaxID=2781243 RepID=UPI00187B6ACD|nr:hypothetical protein [Tenacibaculum finnmarkense]MBE7661231.1 hypothetical protein [Tenacibaculum finnmarkense genomovar finnmarkense]MCG8253162.1 hypothetical protein [Tenacibaculum finnmarkense genomovar finnmarkense]MCG8816551.1 hypothetical protein [Tenacibaculum finnmarkense]